VASLPLAACPAGAASLSAWEEAHLLGEEARRPVVAMDQELVATRDQAEALSRASTFRWKIPARIFRVSASTLR
jgi:hypothetical protein